MKLLKQFISKTKEFQSRRNKVLFWTVMGELFLSFMVYDMYQKGNTTIAIIIGIVALVLISRVGYNVIKYTAEVNQYVKNVSDMFTDDGKILKDQAPPILYISSNKVYEIPRPEIDQWAKTNSGLREKMEKIVNLQSLRTISNFHLLPEDRQALGMHIMMDIEQEVYATIYPVAINQAIEKMGKEAFEKEYLRSDLQCKDLEGNSNTRHIIRD